MTHLDIFVTKSIRAWNQTTFSIVPLRLIDRGTTIQFNIIEMILTKSLVLFIGAFRIFQRIAVYACKRLESFLPKMITMMWSHCKKYGLNMTTNCYEMLPPKIYRTLTIFTGKFTKINKVVSKEVPLSMTFFNLISVVFSGRDYAFYQNIQLFLPYFIHGRLMATYIEFNTVKNR